MPDVNQSELLTAQLEASAAKTREQPRLRSLDFIAQSEQANILAAILDMGDAVIVADENQNLLVFNPAAEEMFGAGATTARADKWSERYGLYLSDQVTPFPGEQLPLTRAIRGETVNDVEMFVKHEKAPRGLWASVSGRPLRDAAGHSFGGVIVCRDITGHKNEGSFRAGQSRILEMIAASAPFGEILRDLVLLIEAQSPEMLCSVLLLSNDGNHIRHGAAPSLPGEYVKAIDGEPIGPKNGSCGTAMFRGKPVIVTDISNDPLWEDYRDLAAASALRACWSTPIMSARGKVLGSFAMYYRQPQTPTGDEARLTDVATHIAALAIEHQAAQEVLRRTQAELAHAAQVTSMRQVAASIGQEVNQTLAAILDNADQCLQSLDENKPGPDQLREGLTNISNEGRRTVEIIARIRALAKVSAAQQLAVNLPELVSEVFSLVGHEAQRKYITLQAELGDGLPSVMGDRVQLQQVLLNLVMNGVEAMTGSEARSLELTVKIDRAENGEVVVAVTDRGSGINPQELDRVFTAFHTTKSASLGMGLSICRSIIEAHGGRLWAEPNIGPGATFKFALPAGIRGV
jgi:PAS domain S-box-containing protein